VNFAINSPQLDAVFRLVDRLLSENILINTRLRIRNGTDQAEENDEGNQVHFQLHT